MIGQYNNWKDPVPYLTQWCAGIAIGTVATTAISFSVLPALPVISSSAFANTTAGTIFSGLMKIGTVGAGLGAGLGAGGGVGWLNLNKYHSFEKYLERDVKGIQEALKDWKEKNMKE